MSQASTTTDTATAPAPPDAGAVSEATLSDALAIAAALAETDPDTDAHVLTTPKVGASAPVNILAGCTLRQLRKMATLIRRVNAKHSKGAAWTAEDSTLWTRTEAAGAVSLFRAVVIALGFEYQPRTKDTNGREGVTVRAIPAGSAPDAHWFVAVEWRPAPKPRTDHAANIAAARARL